ncbi:MAG: efflux RND transporter periplasmic adaptor subunit, partial [Gemmatimonadales bacterium]
MRHRIEAMMASARWRGGPAGRRLLTAGLVLVAACGGGDEEETGQAPAPAVIGPENLAVALDTVLTTGPLLSGTLEPELAATVRAEVGGA